MALATVTLLLMLAGVPVHAQSDPVGPVTCDTFQRIGSGGWQATGPSTLTYTSGLVLNVRRGDTFYPTQPVDGVDVAAMLDRHCGSG